MGKKMLYVMNPVAGRMKVKNELYEILDIFCRAGYDLSIRITQHRGHAAELAASARDRGFDLLVCSGGDGTVRETISGILGSGSDLPFGYIPAGTTNDFAATLGLPTDPLEAARLICRERTAVIDAGGFNDTYFSYVASFGAFTQVSYSASQDLKNVFGYMAYMVEALKSFADIEPVSMKIAADGKDHSGEFLFGCVSNATSVAGVLHPDNIDVNDGLFEVILVRNVQSINDFNNIIVGAATSDFSSDSFDYFKTKDVIFETEKNLFWSLDGEKQEGNRIVHVRNLHSALTIFN